MRRPLIVLLLALTSALGAHSIRAAEYRVVTEESGFAIVTHKGGIAAGLAHDHLVVAHDYAATFEFDPDRPRSTRFELALDAEDLGFDEPDQQARWYPLVESLGLLEEPFEDIGKKDRSAIREAALGPKQLDSASHSRLSASVVAVEASGDAELPWRVTLALEVRGVRVERPVGARFEVGDDGRVTVEATGEFRFTDFGITPYRAMLGAVKNLDAFDVVVRAVATPAPAPAD